MSKVMVSQPVLSDHLANTHLSKFCMKYNLCNYRTLLKKSLDRVVFTCLYMPISVWTSVVIYKNYCTEV